MVVKLKCYLGNIVVKKRSNCGNHKQVDYIFKSQQEMTHVYSFRGFVKQTQLSINSESIKYHERSAGMMVIY